MEPANSFEAATAGLSTLSTDVASLGALIVGVVVVFMTIKWAIKVIKPS